MQLGRLFTFLALTLVVTACESSAPVARVTPKPVAPTTYTAYVIDQINGTLTPIPLASMTPGTPLVVHAPVDLGVAKDLLWGLAIGKNGKMAYITGIGSITPVNLVTKQVLEPIKVNANTAGEPIALVLSPDDKMAYLVDYDARTLTPFTLATSKVGAPIALGAHPPWQIVIAPDGKMAYLMADYVPSGGSTVFDIKSELIPVDLQTQKVGTPIQLGHESGAMTIAADGKTIYAFHLVFDVNKTSGTTITPISLPSGNLGTPIPVPVFVNSMALSPDGKTLYLLNQYGTEGSVAPKGGMLALTLATGIVGSVTVLGAQPSAIAIAQDPS